MSKLFNSILQGFKEFGEITNNKSLLNQIDEIEASETFEEDTVHKSNKSLKEPLSELATHCVYFTQDGIEQIEFEGSEDECNQYIADIQAEQDDEFGNEAPERFIKRLHEKMFVLGESISPEYKMVEYTYDGDELSDYLGHVRVRTNSDKVALHAAEEYVMNKQFERNPRHFKICNDSYNNVDVIDSYGDFLTRLESVTESESYEDMYKYVVEYTFYNVKKSVIYDKRHGHDYAETPEDAEALFQKYVKMAEARGYDSIFVKIARPIFLGTSLIDSDAIKIYSDGEIIKDNMIDESLEEDTVKKANGKWINRGDDGEEHGEFNTKSKADAQRKAMFAKGYKGEGYKMKLKINELIEEDLSNMPVMTIKLQSGINADGFEISIKNSKGNELFSQNYAYGYNASYDKRWADTKAPYTTDIVRDLVNTYNVGRIKIISGKNVFKGTDMPDKCITDFKKNYLSEFEFYLDTQEEPLKLKESTDSYDYDENSEEDRILYDAISTFLADRFCPEFNIDINTVSQFSRFEGIMEALVRMVKQGRDTGKKGSLKEAKKLRAPKFWNTRFADNVIKDYEAGKLTFDNIEEWDTAYNDGRKPNPPFNTKEILDYYLATKDTPQKVPLKSL